MAGSGQGLGAASKSPCPAVGEAGPTPVKLTDFPASFPSGIFAIFPYKILIISI
ncbi:hypothetical protein [Azospirillum melinis]